MISPARRLRCNQAGQRAIRARDETVSDDEGMIMNQNVFKRCQCTRIVHGADGHPLRRPTGGVRRCRLERTCPRLGEPGHGSWWYQIDLPRV